jgi:hypothetical protein
MLCADDGFTMDPQTSPTKLMSILGADRRHGRQPLAAVLGRRTSGAAAARALGGAQLAGLAAAGGWRWDRDREIRWRPARRRRARRHDQGGRVDPAHAAAGCWQADRPGLEWRQPSSGRSDNSTARQRRSGWSVGATVRRATGRARQPVAPPPGRHFSDLAVRRPARHPHLGCPGSGQRSPGRALPVWGLEASCGSAAGGDRRRQPDP